MENSNQLNLHNIFTIFPMQEVQIQYRDMSLKQSWYIGKILRSFIRYRFETIIQVS